MDSSNLPEDLARLAEDHAWAAPDDSNASVPRESLQHVAGEDISTLNLSTRAKNCLLRNGVWTVDELLQWSDKDLLDINNFGRACLAEVKRALQANRIELSGPAVRSALLQYATAENGALFEEQMRSALMQAVEDFDLSGPQKVLSRWHEHVTRIANPPIVKRAPTSPKVDYTE